MASVCLSHPGHRRTEKSSLLEKKLVLNRLEVHLSLTKKKHSSFYWRTKQRLIFKKDRGKKERKKGGKRREDWKKHCWKTEEERGKQESEEISTKSEETEKNWGNMKSSISPTRRFFVAVSRTELVTGKRFYSKVLKVLQCGCSWKIAEWLSGYTEQKSSTLNMNVAA